MPSGDGARRRAPVDCAPLFRLRPGAASLGVLPVGRVRELQHSDGQAGQRSQETACIRRSGNIIGTVAWTAREHDGEIHARSGQSEHHDHHDGRTEQRDPVQIQAPGDLYAGAAKGAPGAVFCGVPPPPF